MRDARVVIRIAATMIAASACRTAAVPGISGQRDAMAVAVRREVMYDRNLISRRDLDRIAALSAYDAVSALRPVFLLDRGPTSLDPGAPRLPLVYLNGAFLGGIEALREVNARDVSEIRYVDTWIADTKHAGRRHPRGAIEVVVGR